MQWNKITDALRRGLYIHNLTRPPTPNATILGHPHDHKVHSLQVLDIQRTT